MAYASPDTRHTGSCSIDTDNQSLLQEIIESCRREDRYGAENVLLIGKSGAGKSALVNTLIKAITGRYYDRATVGRGATQSRTLRSVQYKSCGVTNADLRLAGKECPFSDRELPRLPTIYDIPGLGDTLEEDMKEILRLLIAGRIPVGTGISGLQKLQEKYGIGNLGDIFDTVEPRAKISKIVFVQSAVSKVPKDMIKDLHGVLGETDWSTARLDYEGDVFLVITHYDLVQDDQDPSESVQTIHRRGAGDADSSLHESYDSSDGPTPETSDLARTPNRAYISRSEFKKKEEVLADLFSIEGTLERNRLYWRSFCDKTGYDDPAICNTALKLLTFMMKPTTPATQARPTVTVTTGKIIKLKLKQYLKQLKRSYDNSGYRGWFFIFLTFMVCLCAIVYRALKASPEEGRYRHTHY